MTTPLSVFSLILRQTKDEFFQAMLEVADLVGLPVTTWRTGDPTRTAFRADAEIFEALDETQALLAGSAFLETAVAQAVETGDSSWLKLRAQDTYGVTAEEATYATSTVTLANASGGLYQLAPGGLIVQNSVTGATYANQSTITINPLAPSTVVSVVAQEAGAGGSSGVNDIDAIVSPTLTGVTITASTAAVGSDEQSPEGIKEQCLATLGSLSPAGPADAYEFVARNSTLTGIQGVGRAKAVGDAGDGTVDVYVATVTAGLDAPSVAAIQAAVDEWATPLCVQATVSSGTPIVTPVNLTLTPASPEMQAVAEAAIAEYFAGVNFGGTVAPDAIQSAVRVAIAAAGKGLTIVACTNPAAPVVLGASQFPVVGTVVLA